MLPPHYFASKLLHRARSLSHNPILSTSCLSSKTARSSQAQCLCSTLGHSLRRSHNARPPHSLPLAVSPRHREPPAAKLLRMPASVRPAEQVGPDILSHRFWLSHKNTGLQKCIYGQNLAEIFTEPKPASRNGTLFRLCSTWPFRKAASLSRISACHR